MANFLSAYFRSACLKKLRNVCLTSALIVLFIHGHIQAQPHNGEIYEQLVDQYFQQDSLPFHRISGTIITEWMPEYQVNPSALYELNFSSPLISYSALGQKKYRRSISFSIQRMDSLQNPAPVRLSFADTLNLITIKNVYRNSPKQLKGEDPRPGAKWLKPMTLISLSIGGIISLFFIRSQ